LATQAFDKDEDDPLDADAVIIDEASMIDTMLMHHLLNAVPMTARLILVGDIFQLPSIGPGNVLSDMITSNRIKTFELMEIFRQTDESPIVANAHRIRNGQYPELTSHGKSLSASGFYFIEQSNPNEVVTTIIDLCRKHLPEPAAKAQANEIQVITPMHKGAVGTLNLNQVLQKVMNPVKKGSPSGKGRFRIHDKVMHLKNNYQKEVFNGDIGTIYEIDGQKRKVYVTFDDRIVEYDEEELDELSLAYAISVHKSQGSEYPVVIIPMLTQHFVMLQRNLLYTAITRGQRLVIIVGTRKALEVALKNDKPQQRMSSLAERLAWKSP
jgi:exodeoxyribonuclease V alpha subunit